MSTRRIHIIGGPGSGKTTLAGGLAAHDAVPTYDLDAVAYEGGAGRKRALPDRLADVRRIAAEPAWITEGIYLWWTDELLRNADVIIWLDLPWRITAWRIIARHARTSLAGTNPHRGLRKLLRFLRSTRGYYRGPAVTPTVPDNDGATSRAATVECLAPYTGKLIHCRRTASVDTLLDRCYGDNDELLNNSQLSSDSGSRGVWRSSHRGGRSGRRQGARRRW